MSSGYEHLVWSLERRFDFLSARTVAAEAVKGAGLEEKAKYSDDELGSIVQLLGGASSRMEAVWGALGAAPDGVAMPVAAVSDLADKEAVPSQEASVSESKAPAKKAATKKASAKKAPAKKAAAKKS